MLRRVFSDRILLFATVIPTLASALYFGLLASDVYVSEARFVVRSPERQAATPLGLILKGAGFQRAQDDAYTVQDFILSRDALRALDEELGIRERYSSASIDLLSRFPGVDLDRSFEALHLYYQKRVAVQFDATSSITTLSTRAFSADDAVAINRRLLELAEELVNRLNERGRQDLVRFAAAEVAAAQSSAREATLALARYRNEKGVIDPEKQSTIPLQQIAKLQDELVATKAHIGQLEKVALDNPQLPVLRQRARLLESEIGAEAARVAGAGEGSLAGKAAHFQRLALEKEFADRMLASAMSTLEQARSEAQRKQLYLERIVQPSRPDAPTEPKRVKSVLVTLVVSLMVWGILSLLAASIREHRE